MIVNGRLPFPSTPQNMNGIGLQNMTESASGLLFTDLFSTKHGRQGNYPNVYCDMYVRVSMNLSNNVLSYKNI